MALTEAGLSDVSWLHSRGATGNGRARALHDGGGEWARHRSCCCTVDPGSSGTRGLADACDAPGRGGSGCTCPTSLDSGCRPAPESTAGAGSTPTSTPRAVDEALGLDRFIAGNSMGLRETPPTTCRTPTGGTLHPDRRPGRGRDGRSDDGQDAGTIGWDGRPRDHGQG